MHIILGILGTLVTILVLVNRLSENGMDIGWLNPFSWHRRRKYRLHHDLNPAFKLPSPLDSTALLLVSIAKADGDISKEQKAVLLALFEDKFHLSSAEAGELLRASVFLFGDGSEILANPQRILDSSLPNFSPEQLESMQDLMQSVANAEHEPSTAQQQIIKSVSGVLPKSNQDAWS